MSRFEVATNYAKALYDTSKEAGNSESILHQLFELQKALNEVGQDIHFNEEEIKAFIKKFPFEKELKQVLETIGFNDRFPLIPLIHERFQNFLDEEMNVIRGTITSAGVLNTEQRQDIENYVANVTGKRAILAYQEDSSVLGGFVVNVGSMKMDGSLKNQLENMKNLITNGVH